jgi:predicted DNA-binding mobile mystery protein A
MRPRFLRERAMHELDAALKQWQPSSDAPPARGWLWAVRETLAMTTRQLARRIGVSQAAVCAAERAERDGNISLATLRRYAEGLDCKLVYSLCPDRGSLRRMFDARVDAVIGRRMARLEGLPRKTKENLPLRLQLRRAALSKGKRTKIWK